MKLYENNDAKQIVIDNIDMTLIEDGVVPRKIKDLYPELKHEQIKLCHIIKRKWKDTASTRLVLNIESKVSLFEA